MEKIRLKIDKKNKAPVLFTLLLLSVWLRFGIGLEIPVFLFSTLAIVIAIIGNNDDIIALIMCCIPLHTSIQYMMIVAIAMLLFLVKNYKFLNSSIKMLHRANTSVLL